MLNTSMVRGVPGRLALAFYSADDAVRRRLFGAATIIGLIGAAWIVWNANLHFGRTVAEIDYGDWYILHGSSGSTYYDKAVDIGNRYLPGDSAERMLSRTPGYGGIVRRKYGAYVEYRGWLEDAYVKSIPWRIFETERDAVTYLVGLGVQPRAIRYVYR
jgi:hypothetical protein